MFERIRVCEPAVTFLDEEIMKNFPESKTIQVPKSDIVSQNRPTPDAIPRFHDISRDLP
jgi:hypothetical protein